MSDVVYRYHVHNQPPKGSELSDAAKKDPTVHKFTRTTGMTGCGKLVPQGDKRWKINREGEEKEINCARCLHPKAAPGERKAKKIKTTVKKAGRGKRAAKKAAQPITTGTAVPKERMKELRKKAKAHQAAGSSGSPAPEPPEPEYDPTAEEDDRDGNSGEPDLLEQEGSHEPINRPAYDPLAYE